MSIKTWYFGRDNGMYLEGLHESIPNDAVKITEELREELLLGESQGKSIVWTDDLPTLTEGEPDIALLKENRSLQFNKQYKYETESGLVCDAVGYELKYTQSSINSALPMHALGKGGKVLCSSVGGSRAMVHHTHEQLCKVLAYMAEFTNGLMLKLIGLEEDLAKLEDEKSILNLTW